MKTSLKILVWILPLINYLWCAALDIIDNQIHSESAINVYDIPFVQYIILVINIFVLFYLYFYLFLIHKYKQHYGKITLTAAIVQLFIVLFVYIYNTFHFHDNYNQFPILDYFYSFLYYVPFYVVAYFLVRKTGIHSAFISEERNK